MTEPSAVFDHHYDQYLKQLGHLDFQQVADAAGAELCNGPEGRALCLTYFNLRYTLSSRGIFTGKKEKAAYDTCAILSRYLIMAGERNPGLPAPETLQARNLQNKSYQAEISEVKSSQAKPHLADASKAAAPSQGDWVGFRDLKDAGPLTVYFKDNVESALAAALTGKAGTAAKTLCFLAPKAPELDARYDVMLELVVLPNIPLLLLFNDAEDGFPATCSVLFRSDVASHLDAECIAMTGYRLAALVRSAMKGSLTG